LNKSAANWALVWLKIHKLFKVLVYLLVVFWEGGELVEAVKFFIYVTPAAMQYKTKKEEPNMKGNQQVDQIEVKNENRPTLFKEPLARPASH